MYVSPQNIHTEPYTPMWLYLEKEPLGKSLGLNEIIRVGSWSHTIRDMIKGDIRMLLTLSLSSSTKERPYEDTERRWPSAGQEDRSYWILGQNLDLRL